MNQKSQYEPQTATVQVPVIKQLEPKTVYCHFSFRRPRESEYGYFSTMFFKDYECTHPLARTTHEVELWKRDKQFVTACQSYEYALSQIYKFQAEMIKYGVARVMLVTDNSTLAKWIENPKKCKSYAWYLEKALCKYRAGEAKELLLNIGLCNVVKSEKSYKFCSANYVQGKTYAEQQKENKAKGYRISIGNFELASDIISKHSPSSNGIEELNRT